MKKLIVPFLMGSLCISFTHSSLDPFARSAGWPVVAATPSTADAVYERMDLSSRGLSRTAFLQAFRGFENLNHGSALKNGNVLTICDFSRSSAEKRLYIIDLSTEEILFHTYVAHGKNSGGEYATRFSNTPESLQSSIGFYVTGNTYIGKHGLSLRLIGVDGKFNDKAFERTIVIHGADYVNEGRVNAGGYMGRSWGCPAVSKQEAPAIIETIKNGTCFFAYYPSEEYTTQSKILND